MSNQTKAAAHTPALVLTLAARVVELEEALGAMLQAMERADPPLVQFGGDPTEQARAMNAARAALAVKS